uniref:Uncharacterized protein n=1 Tax=Romanomermis culicivorax TaxID=13658 RepID=A0A915L3Z1_ROMCU
MKLFNNSRMLVLEQQLVKWPRHRTAVFDIQQLTPNSQDFQIGILGIPHRHTPTWTNPIGSSGSSQPNIVFNDRKMKASNVGTRTRPRVHRLYGLHTVGLDSDLGLALGLGLGLALGLTIPIDKKT